MDVGSLSDLSDGTPGINGFRRVYTQPLGYVIRVQVEGVRGYDEDHVALVQPDSTTFGTQILVILGTPIINRIINVIKEHEIDELSASMNGLRIAWLLACCQAELLVKSDASASPASDPTNFSEAVKTTRREKIFHQR